MTRITGGTWGRDMASGVLQDVGREAGLVDGDQVDIEIQDGDIVISKRLPPCRQNSRLGPWLPLNALPNAARPSAWVMSLFRN